MKQRPKPGEAGFLRFIKRLRWILALTCTVAAAAIFFYGLSKNGGDRKTVWSVLAALMMLPAAKEIVGIVVTLPYRSVDKALAERVLTACKGSGARLYADCLMSSEQRLMYADFAAVTGKEIVLLCLQKPKDADRIEEYLKKAMKERNLSLQVKKMDSEEKFTRFVSGYAGNSADAVANAAFCRFFSSILYR